MRGGYLAVLLLLGIMLSLGYVNGITQGEDQLDQQQTHANFYCNICCPGQMFAQSFVPSMEILTRVQLKLFGGSEHHGIKVSIRENLYGKDLTSCYLSPPLIIRSKQWIEFDFPDILVEPGKTYYIVWDPDDGGEPCFAWGVGSGYEKGRAFLFDGKEWLPFEHCGQDDFTFKTYGRNTKPFSPSIKGPSNVTTGYEYAYTFCAIDPDAGKLYYYIDWGDGSSTGWIGPFFSGEMVKLSHKWIKGGEYTIRAKVKDNWGVESDWSKYQVHVSAPSIEISSISGGIGRVSAVVMNRGDASATCLEWSIEIEGMVIDGSTHGIIYYLGSGERVEIKSRFVFGIGDIVVTVRVDGVAKQATGFCVGPFVMITG